VTLKSGLESFKVIENGTIRKLGYGSYLCIFHRNYGSILYHSRDKVGYWPKIIAVRFIGVARYGALGFVPFWSLLMYAAIYISSAQR